MVFTLAERFLFIFLFVIYNISFFIGLYQMYKYRKMEFMNSRRALIGVFSLFFISIWYNLDLLEYSVYDKSYCIIRPIIFCFLLPMFCISITLRCGLLFFAWSLTKNRVAFIAKDRHEKSTQEWFLRNRRLFKPFTIYLVFFTFLGLHLLLVFIIMFFNPEYSFKENTEGCNNVFVDGFFFIICPIYLSIFLYFLWRNRKVEDNYFIKKEILRISQIGSFYFVLFIVLDNIQGLKSFEVNVFPLETLLSSLTLFGVSLTLIWYPVIKLKLFYKEMAKNDGDASGVVRGRTKSRSFIFDKKEFEKMLENNKFFEAFRTFLVKEFAVENLLFLKSINKFLKMIDDKNVVENIVAESKWIVETYISDDSPLQINISHDKQKNLLQAFEKLIECITNDSNYEINKDIFILTKEAILSLLFCDSFRRFLLSKEGQVLRDTSTFAPAV